jgi:hypothetical protein
VTTPRKNGLTEEDMGAAIEHKLQEDPLGRWGYRKVQEKLGLQGILIPRYVTAFVAFTIRVIDTQIYKN